MNLDTKRVFDSINRVDLSRLALGYHFVLKFPARAACELRYNDIAVAKEVDVEVDVVDWLHKH